MSSLALAHTEPIPAARLLIHVKGAPSAWCKPFQSIWHRLRSLCFKDSRGKAPAVPSVQIHDLQGQRVFATDAAGALIDLPLPAGTYHVSASIGKLRRSYTMTLEQGASFDLFLRLPAPPATRTNLSTS